VNSGHQRATIQCLLLTQSGSRAPDFAVTQHGSMLW
jgi:hypothetical protein